MRKAGYEPLVPYPGRNSVPWLSRHIHCGEKVSPCYSTIRGGGGGCWGCGHAATGAAKRVALSDASAVMRNAGAAPVGPYPGNKSLPWVSRCLGCGRLITPTYGTVRRGKGPCIYCAGMAPTAAREAHELMQQAGWEPQVLYPGQKRLPWQSRCVQCGELSSPRLGLVLSGVRCKYCKGNAINPMVAEAAMRAAGVVPLEPYLNNHSPWLCKCLTCGSEVLPSYGNVQRGQGGCSNCKFKGQTVIYLIKHLAFRSVKIGIASQRSCRIEFHQRLGWVVLDTWPVADRATANVVESAVLRDWREAGTPYGVSAADMPRGGYTETAPLDQVDLAATRQIVEAAIKSGRG